jgi:Bacterial regulatory helix-turn-helix protein, lysR family
MRAAGRALGLSQPTIARRLAAFETSFGGQTLFDRLPEGLRLNAVGEQLIAAAEGVEDVTPHDQSLLESVFLFYDILIKEAISFLIGFEHAVG